jgi:ATP-binding cassette, subfamily F, member 2
MARKTPDEIAAEKKAEEEKEAKKAKALADKARRKAEADARKKGGDLSGAGGGGSNADPSTESTSDPTGSSSSIKNTNTTDASEVSDPSSSTSVGTRGLSSSAGSNENGGGGGGLEALAAKSQASIDKEELGGEAEHRRLMNQAMERVTITTSTYQNKVHPNSRDVKISNLTVVLKGKDLLSETDLNLSWGQRYGLLGPNGCGKSILLTLVGKRQVPLPANMDSFHLVSEVDPSDMTALEAVMAVDTERASLERTAAEIEESITGEDTLEQTELSMRLAEIYERLEEMGAATAEARASQILFGLGFDTKMQAKKCKAFSGGWRMRVALARALFLGPSLLLLDEPTNHLDMEAVVWLEKHLATFSKILVMVSHSQDFMNEVCTQIIRIHKRKLEYFGGNYDQYVETKMEKEKEQMQKYEWEQDQIAHMKDFIARFGHGTRKMAMQAQSREKVLQKMTDAGLVEKVEFDRKLNMTFPNPSSIPPPVLMLANISFGYPGCPLLYENVDFGVDLDSRIALVGPNGAGKTTLLKLIAGELVPTSGAVRPNPHLRMARYTQHFVDALDLTLTPLEYFQILMPDTPVMGEGGLRTKLGRFGISGEHQTQIMAELSDGIKSRVVFALMATKTPHILLLDEPTNHLDIETIDSLADAIKRFEGGVVLVSHDMRLIDQVANEILECDRKCITKVKGDITAYKKQLQIKLEAAAVQFERTRGGGGGGGGSQATAPTTVSSTLSAPSLGDEKKKKEKGEKNKVPPQTTLTPAASPTLLASALAASAAPPHPPQHDESLRDFQVPLARSIRDETSKISPPSVGIEGTTTFKFAPRIIGAAGAGGGGGGWRERLAAKEAAAAAAAAASVSTSEGAKGGEGGGDTSAW